MIAVIFENWPMDGQMQKYLDMGQALGAHLDGVDGFISIERFQSVTDPEKLLALSFWRDEEAVTAWRQLDVHREVQAKSRDEIFREYRLRVAAIIRDYGKNERAEAPADSQAVHG